MNYRRLTTILIIAFGSLSPLRSDSVIEFTYAPEGTAGKEILDSLAAGHRSEIHYEARVYRRTAGISRIFGDRIVAEATVQYEVRWDEFNQRYVVLIDGERERSFSDPEALLGFLLVLDGYRLPVPEADSQELYLMCRAQIEPIRLVPPLTLMTFLVPKFRTTTSWTEVDFRWFIP